MTAPTPIANDNDATPIGQLIRKRRLELGLAQIELARRIDKSPSYVSSLESGKIAPSLTTLRHIAAALETVLGYFFTQPSLNSNHGADEVDRLRIVHPATRKMLVDPNRHNVRWELLSPDLQRQMEVVQMTMEPGAVVGEEEWLIHAGEECGIVLEGRLQVEFLHETYTLERGDSLYFPSTQPHRIRNIHDQATTAIWVITPPSW
ncbi:MAG: cupin domain-containing protein [Anaerolineae bacterium]|nr:cupin domain-containing protein [Anaerolineae bacterium]